MTVGSPFGRDDRATLGLMGTSLVRSVVWSVGTMLVLVSTSLPAQAQRPGRRWRTPPPPPRTQPAPRPAMQPMPPTTSGARTGSQASGPQASGPQASGAQASGAGEAKPSGKGAPPPGRKTDARPPQTTALPAAPAAPRPSNGAGDPAAALGWDGPSPFSAAWRVEHPGAWRPEEGDGEIVLAGGQREPTQVDSRALELAAWTARMPAEEPTAARSVLQASAESPAPDLVVFPDADGAVPAALAARPELPPAEAGIGTGEAVAADGTVSVLVRGGGPSSTGPEPTNRPLATVSLSNEEASSPWLPLGTFAAVAAGADRPVAPHVFLELSLHRDGTVRGNYFDAVSDAVQPVAGRFDRETGTLTWRIGGRGAEFETTADGLAAGRVEATVRRGTSERTWVLIGLP